MKITRSADWRDAIPFETPVPAAEVGTIGATRCAECGADAAPLEVADLWVVKHRHPTNPAGFVRVYCGVHMPRPAPRVVAVEPRSAARRPAASRPPRAAAPRRPTPAVERPRAVCPDCFIEVPATGVCGMCGRQVA